MNKVQIYTTNFCPYCRRAKHLLDNKGIEFEEINLDSDPEKKFEIMSKLNWRTVPIILINGQLIGGYDQLAALDRTNELNELLK